jgi:hypothetical protein
VAALLSADFHKPLASLFAKIIVAHITEWREVVLANQVLFMLFIVLSNTLNSSLPTISLWLYQLSP